MISGFKLLFCVFGFCGTILLASCSNIGITSLTTSKEVTTSSLMTTSSSSETTSSREVTSSSSSETTTSSKETTTSSSETTTSFETTTSSEETTTSSGQPSTSSECVHEWDEGKYLPGDEPTCTKGGIKTYTCKKCGDTREESVKELGHDFSVVKQTIEPTCTEQGYTVYKCSRCSETEIRDYVSPKGHQYNHYTTRDATCSLSGCKEYWECTTCGDVLLSSPGVATEKGVATITVPSSDQRYIAPINHKFVYHYAVKPTYLNEGRYGYFSCSNCQTIFDDDYNPTTLDQLKISSFSNTCPDILDDILSDDRSTKSNWDEVVNNVKNWSHTPNSHSVYVPSDKTGWQLTKQSYGDIDMKVKIDGVGFQDPYITGSYITKAIIIGGNASIFGSLPSGYLLAFFTNESASGIHIYHWADQNVNNYQGAFLGDIYGDFNNREVRIKVEGNVLSLYDYDGRFMLIQEARKGLSTTSLPLTDYKGGKVGVFSWTEATAINSTFYINDFAGIKIEEQHRFDIKGKEYSKLDASKRVSVFILAGQSNMEGNTQIWQDDKYYLRDYCNGEGAKEGHNYEKLMNGYDNIHISYHNRFPYKAPNMRGQLKNDWEDGEGHNFSNPDDPFVGKFVKAKGGQGLHSDNRWMGPELGISEKLSAKYPNEQIFLIKYCAGGTGFQDFAEWNSPSTGKYGCLYGSMVQYAYNNIKLISEMGYVPIVKGFLWLQGDCDSNPGPASHYERFEKSMVNDFRKEFQSFAVDNNAAKLNFIDAKIYLNAPDADGVIRGAGYVVNQAKTNIAESNPNINSLVTGSEKYPMNKRGAGGGDQFHYDADAMLHVGNDFGDIIINKNLIGWDITPGQFHVCKDGNHNNVSKGFCLDCQTITADISCDVSEESGKADFVENFGAISMSGNQDFEVTFEVEYNKARENVSDDGPWAIAGGQDGNKDFYIQMRPDWYVPTYSGHFTKRDGSPINSRDDFEKEPMFNQYADFDEFIKGKSQGKAYISFIYKATMSGVWPRPENQMRVQIQFISTYPGLEGKQASCRYQLYGIGFETDTALNPVYLKVGNNKSNMKLLSCHYTGQCLGWFDTAAL